MCAAPGGGRLPESGRRRRPQPGLPERAPFQARLQTAADIGALRWGLLAWADPDREDGLSSPFWAGIEAEVRGRGLPTHESKGFRERGFSSSLAFDRTPGDRGLSLEASTGKNSHLG